MCSETRSSTSIQTSSAERGTGYFTQALTIASTRSWPSGVITRFPDSSPATSPCSSRTDRSRYAVLTLISNLSATVEGPTSPHSSTVIKTFCCLSEMFILGTASGYFLCGANNTAGCCSGLERRAALSTETVATVPPPMLSSMVTVPPTFSTAARAMPKPAPTPRISRTASGVAPEKPNSNARSFCSIPGPLSEILTTLPSSNTEITTPLNPAWTRFSINSRKASSGTPPPEALTSSITNPKNFLLAAGGEAAETSLTSGSPSFGYTATLTVIPASPASVSVWFAYITCPPDYCVPLTTTLEYLRRK